MTGAGLCRLAGSLLIVSSAIVVRQSTLSSWRQEVNTLAALGRNLAFLESGVRVSLTPVPQLIEEMPQDPETKDFFEEVLEQLHTEREPTLEQAWKASTDRLSLAQEERGWVRALGGQLDQDAPSVSRAIRHTEELLQGAENRRRKELIERQRLCSALVFSGSAMLICLLL